MYFFLVYNKVIPSYMGGLTSSSANIIQVIEIFFLFLDYSEFIP